MMIIIMIENIKKLIINFNVSFSVFSEVFADVGASVEVGVVDPALAHIVSVDETGVLGQVVLTIGRQMLSQRGVVGSVRFLSHSESHSLLVSI